MTKELNWRDSIEACIAFSSRDWSLNHGDAWIYGVIMGWSPESLAELKQKHNWSDSTVTLLKRLHKRYLKEAMTDQQHHPISPPRELVLQSASESLATRSRRRPGKRQLARSQPLAEKALNHFESFSATFETSGGDSDLIRRALVRLKLLEDSNG